MAEWSIAAVLKTVELKGSWGSNPYLSAINAECQQFTRFTPGFTPKNVKPGVFFCFFPYLILNYITKNRMIEIRYKILGNRLTCTNK